ncbi:mitochondrial ribosomal subunit S27-domain-containing protein [Blastocladiella britannica]|nr:mitochondrial ribosomal subunit S27-domain-containing protein [Blastocladiella britannica]
MASTLGAKVRALNALSCSVFQTVHNPTHARTGLRVLRDRLAGPQLTSYYPAEELNLTRLNAALKPTGIKLVDFEDQLRLDKIKALKARGKGAPLKGQGKAGLKKKKK